MEAELSHQLRLIITDVEGLHTSSKETPNEKLMRNKVLLVEEMYLKIWKQCTLNIDAVSSVTTNGIQ